MADVQLQAHAGRAEVIDLSMSDVETAARPHHRASDAIIDLHMSDDESDNGGVTLPENAFGFVPFEADDHVAPFEVVKTGRLRNSHSQSHDNHSHNDAPRTRQPLQIHPAELFLQNTAAFAVPGEDLWRLPVTDDVSHKVARKAMDGRISSTEAIFRVCCDRIRNCWQVEPAEALPQVFRESTPYSLALLSQLSRLCTISKNDVVSAHALLHEAWQYRLRNAGHEQRTDLVSLVSTTVIGTAKGHKKKLSDCEEIVQENIHGIVLTDVVGAINIITSQLNHIIRCAGRKMKRKEAARIRQAGTNRTTRSNTKYLALGAAGAAQQQETNAFRAARREDKKVKREGRKATRELAHNAASAQAPGFTAVNHSHLPIIVTDTSESRFGEQGYQSSVFSLDDVRRAQRFAQPVSEIRGHGALHQEDDAYALQVAALEQQHEARKLALDQAQPSPPTHGDVRRPHGFVHPLPKRPNTGALLSEYDANTFQIAPNQQLLDVRSLAPDEARVQPNKVMKEIRWETKQLAPGITPTQTAPHIAEQSVGLAGASRNTSKSWHKQPRELPRELSLDSIRRARNGEDSPEPETQDQEMLEVSENYTRSLTSREDQRFRSMAALMQYRLHTNDKGGPGTMDDARAARFQSKVNTDRRRGKDAGNLPMDAFDFDALGTLQEGLVEEKVKKVTKAMQETTLQRRQK